MAVSYRVEYTRRSPSEDFPEVDSNTEPKSSAIFDELESQGKLIGLDEDYLEDSLTKTEKLIFDSQDTADLVWNNPDVLAVIDKYNLIVTKL